MGQEKFRSYCFNLAWHKSYRNLNLLFFYFIPSKILALAIHYAIYTFETLSYNGYSGAKSKFQDNSGFTYFGEEYEILNRWLKWNIDTEIFARTMAGWEQIVEDKDPYLPYLDDEQRKNLKSKVEELKNL